MEETATNRVVLIDADEDDYLFLEHGLTQWTNHTTLHRFPSGEVFVDSVLWQQHTFQVILLELMLPGQDGLDWLRLFRVHECCRQVPVVLYSALDMERESYLQLGAAEVIAKPHHLASLKQVVETIQTNWLVS